MLNTFHRASGILILASWPPGAVPVTPTPPAAISPPSFHRRAGPRPSPPLRFGLLQILS
jgi:hypothetical protein